jgi:hypothetical protein
MTAFHLGQIVVTPAALTMLNEHNVDAIALLSKHSQGDWGICCKDDWESNNQALITGDRLFSVYGVGQTKVYVITESDRSATTLLLPSDY